MKRLLTILADLVIVYGSIFLGFQILGGGLTDYEGNVGAFEIISPLIGILYLVLMYTFGLYNFARKKLQDVIYTVFLVSFSLMIGIMAICFFVREGALAFPRSVIFLSAAIYFIVLVIWRTIIWKASKNKHGVKNITVVGPEANRLAEVLANKYKDIYRIKYLCIDENDENLTFWIKDTEEVFISSGISNKGREKILLAAAEHDSSIYFVPEYRDVAIMSSAMEKTDDIPTFQIPKIELTLEERFVKRSLDLILASIGLILALPIALITAFLVKLDKGPVFYTQERLTQNGKIFKVLKFRTMVPHAEKLSGPVFAGENDPRITKTGRFMRAARLDEIPQILNILQGDMSIVGPRPERPFFTEQFERNIPHYRQRLKVKAGLTGLAQVEGKYNTSVEDKLRYDLIYIGNYSLFQDLLIILQTVKILFVKDSTEGINP